MDLLKDEISILLRDHPRGLTIVELAGITQVSTTTVSKTLAEMKGAGEIEIRRAGSAKLHYWKGQDGET